MLASPSLPVLSDAHFQEWRDSKVDPDLIRLNVVSLSGSNPLDYLLYSDSIPRRNDGRLRDRTLERYRHTEQGGWWCLTLDPETGEPSLWGCFKPDKPRKTKEKGFDGSQRVKLIKYEHPPKVATELFCLKVPLHIWQLVAKRCGIAMPDNIEICPITGEAKGFWPWVIAENVPITITEGAKKAGALLTAGYVAVALPGISLGYRQPKDALGKRFGLPHLIPQLEIFSRPGRNVNFSFDNDSKPVTKFNVSQAISRTGGLLEKGGCQVSVITWDSPEKGVDDLIAAHGVDAFHRAYERRQRLEAFNLVSTIDLSPKLQLRANQPYLDSSIQPPAEAQLIGIKSAKGTGKTEWLAKRVETALAKGQPVLALTHRQQLAKELGERLGVEYRTELTEVGKVAGYALCVDSLHPRANPPFNPDHWPGAMVIMDEAEQVIWHLLNSSTCQRQRVAILETFQRLLQNVIATGGKIYLSDADLSPIAIDYVEKLVGVPITRFIVQNDYCPNKGKRQVYSYDSPQELLSRVFAALEAGEKVIIHTSAQKAKSKWGTTNLEATLAEAFPDRKILRIDSQTIANPNYPAYGCMGNLNGVVTQYDVVLASPTLETGVSLDVKHFNRVFCFALGVQTVDAVCQALERVRDHVPRHIYAVKRSNQQLGNGAISIKSLLRSEHEKFRANQAVLSTADEIGSLYGARPEHLKTWAKRACVVNAGFKDYRANILAKLEAEGYEQLPISTEESPMTPDKIKKLVEATAKANYRKECEEIAAAETPNGQEYEELVKKSTKTEAERLKQRKGKLSRRYLTENITAEMVQRDDEGWYQQLQLHYYLTTGRDFLSERDRARLLKLGEMSAGKVFKPDANRACLSVKIRALEIIDIYQFFDSEREWTKDDLDDWLAKLVNWRGDLKAILGVAINPERDSAIAVVQRLLKLLGLKLVCTGQRRVEGIPKRFYRFAPPNDGREGIFAGWLQRDCHTNPVKDISTGEVLVA